MSGEIHRGNHEPDDPREEIDRFERTIDRVNRERHEEFRNILLAYDVGLKHYHGLLLVAIAIIGFAPNALSNESLRLNPWFIRRGLESLVVTVIIGSVIEVASHVFFRIIVNRLTAAHGRFEYLMGEAHATPLPDRLTAIIRGYRTSSEELQPFLTFVRRMNMASIVGDVAFYVSLLYGVICLFRAIPKV